MKRFVSLIANCGLFISFSAAAADKIELRTGAQDNAPKYVKSSGEMTGLCVDIIKAIEAADPGIRFTGYQEFVPWARILEQLDSGVFDAFVGIVKNPEREKKFTFIDTPVYELNHTVAVRADDNVTVKTLDDIQKLGTEGIILTNTGVAHVDYLKDKGKGKLTVDSSSKDFEGNFTKLIHKRGRFFYLNDIELVANLKNFKEKEKIKVLDVSFDKFPHYVAVSKKAPPATLERVKAAVEKASKGGDFAKIFEKYRK